MSDSAPLIEIFSSIQGEGPYVGCRQAFIRFHGCNLGCAYCDTLRQHPPQSCRIEIEPGRGQFRDLPNPLSLDQVCAVLRGWNERHPHLCHHSLSITGGEPLIHFRLLTEWLPVLREMLPIYLETNGSLPDELAEVVRHVDYISMDIKLPSATGQAPLPESNRKFLKLAVPHKTFVKVVVAEETPEQEIEDACLMVRDVYPAIPLILQPVTRNGVPAVTASRLLQLQEFASGFLPDVRIIPQTHVFLNFL
jgi:7-carboxy-7-deazaguanine synthase